MNEHTIDQIDNVEVELAGLREKLHESFSHFDELKRIIASLETLARTNEEYSEAIKTLCEEHVRIVDDTDQLLKKVETSSLKISGRIDEELKLGLGNVASAIEGMTGEFATLQIEIQANWDELKGKFDTLTEDLYTSQRNLRTEFSGKITDLQRDFERRMASFIEDINTLKTNIQQQVDENTKNQIELKKSLDAQTADIVSQLAHIDQEIQGLNTKWQERYAALDSRLTIITSDLSRTQEYGRKTRNLLLAIFLPSLVLIASAIVVLFFIK